MKKGQVTIFFLLGLVIIIIFGLILFFKSASKTDVKLTNTDLDEQKLVNYVESCLSTSTQEALEKISTNGGAIFVPNGLPATLKKLSVGEMKLPTRQNQKILYGILANKNSLDLLTPDPLVYQESLLFMDDDSGYPYGYDSLINPKNYDSGPLGVYALPALCKLGGPNKNSQDNENVACPLKLYKTGRYSASSVQEMMQEYIDFKMFNCVNDQIITDLSTELGASQESIGSSTEVIFTLGSVIVNYNFPLTLKNSDGKEIKLNTFSHEEQVRLLPMFTFMRELLLKEVKYKNFDLTNETDYNSLNSQDGFSVYPKQVVDLTNEQKAYLVTVVDTKSSFLGDYYSFNFLVENRDPLFDQSPASTNLMSAQQLCNMVIDPDDEELGSYFINMEDGELEFSCNGGLATQNPPLTDNPELYLSACDELGLCLTRINPIYVNPGSP